MRRRWTGSRLSDEPKFYDYDRVTDLWRGATRTHPIGQLPADRCPRRRRRKEPWAGVILFWHSRLSRRADSLLIKRISRTCLITIESEGRGVSFFYLNINGFQTMPYWCVCARASEGGERFSGRLRVSLKCSWSKRKSNQRSTRLSPSHFSKNKYSMSTFPTVISTSDTPLVSFPLFTDREESLLSLVKIIIMRYTCGS